MIWAFCCWQRWWHPSGNDNKTKFHIIIVVYYTTLFTRQQEHFKMTAPIVTEIGKNGCTLPSTASYHDKRFCPPSLKGITLHSFPQKSKQPNNTFFFFGKLRLIYCNYIASMTDEEITHRTKLRLLSLTKMPEISIKSNKAGGTV